MHDLTVPIILFFFMLSIDIKFIRGLVPKNEYIFIVKYVLYIVREGYSCTKGSTVAYFVMNWKTCNLDSKSRVDP